MSIDPWKIRVGGIALIMFGLGLAGGVVLADFLDYESGTNNVDGNTTSAEKVGEVPYGERGVFRVTAANGTTCYVAQTYSGSGYATSIDCMEADEL